MSRVLKGECRDSIATWNFTAVMTHDCRCGHNTVPSPNPERLIVSELIVLLQGTYDTRSQQDMNNLAPLPLVDFSLCLCSGTVQTAGWLP